MLNFNILEVINVRWFNAEAAYVLSLSRKLKERGHRVMILGLKGSPIINEAKGAGLEVLDSFSLNSLNPVICIVNLTKIVQLLKREKFDLINAHRSEGYPVLAMATRLLGDRPALIRTRGDVRPVKENVFNKYLYNNLTDGIITSGEFLKADLVQRLELDPSRIETIYAGIDFNRFRSTNPSAFKSELKLDESTPLVGILGRLSPVKCQENFIEAAGVIKAKFPGARFIIIAKELNEHEPRLKKICKDKDMENDVHFLGFRKDLSDVLASCDVGVITSIGSEANCRVALEWMASGKPVVATRVGVIPELIQDGINGLIVPPKDPAALATAINKILSDKDLANNMGQKGRQIVQERFSDDIFATKTERFYEQIHTRHLLS